MTTDPALLVDGRYSFEDLVDVDRLGAMITSFSQASGFTTGLVTHPKGRLLVATGRRHLCTSFHRAVSSSSEACARCESTMVSLLSKEQPLIVHRCDNGLVEGAAAIMIRDAHVASVYSGQVFFEKPDLEWFRSRALAHGYDVEHYLELISEVPIVNEDRFVLALEFLREMAVLVAEQGLAAIEIHAQARAAEASEAKFRALVETSSDWIWEVDEKGVYTYASPQVADILGYTPAEVIGKTPFDLMPGDEATRVAEAFRALVAEGKPIVGLENINRHKNGGEVVLETSGVPVVDDTGRVTGYRGVDRDVTERKRADDERQTMQRMQSIGLLAGGIAHDFNNLLMGVYGNVSLAVKRLSSDHPAARPLSEAVKSMDRASRLTHQLLTFSKGGSPAREPTDLAELVRDTTAFHTSGSTVSTVFEIAPGLWPVEIDRGQMQQAFSNLLINAMQAMPNGGTITISMENTDIPPSSRAGVEPGRYVRTAIRDQGVGIPADDVGRIFDPYFTTKSSGSGLGLTTVYSIITKHGGALRVDSTPGRGSTFTLDLPASPDTKTRGVTGLGAATGAELTGVRVLVMDDEDVVRQVVQQMLESFGCEVETAARGDDAVRLYRHAADLGRPFDAVIMDLTVPGGVGGKEAVTALLRADPDARVIVSSGYADDPVLADHARYGFVDVIAKPFSLEALHEVVHRVVGDRR